jgi:hypothetical protein
MISIIICHRKQNLLAAIKASIEQTVGIPYELIVIDNTSNQHTILSAYNEGVKKSKFDILCFSHEDVLFYSQNWGQSVIEHFADPGTGMIGVAGGMAQSVVPSAWWYNNYFSRSARNLLMRKASDDSYQLYHHYSNPLNEPHKTEVVIIDGLWFCIRKSLFTKISFDENTYKGFHLYDADISLQVSEHSKTYVVFNILMEHLWSGNISADYYDELIKFANKWQSRLPIASDGVDNSYLDKYNWHALRNLILEMKGKNIPREKIAEVYKKYYPMVKARYFDVWFNSYFIMSKLIGYNNANRLYFRLEKLFGIRNASSNTIEKYTVKKGTLS